MPYIGCHLSSTKGNYEMVKTAKQIGADTFAFFTRNPRGSKAKPIDSADCQKAMEAMKQWNFGLAAPGIAGKEGKGIRADLLCGLHHFIVSFCRR